jgi:hypothetical protein
MDVYSNKDADPKLCFSVSPEAQQRVNDHRFFLVCLTAFAPQKSGKPNKLGG